jgi:hypothetical protein
MSKPNYPMALISAAGCPSLDAPAKVHIQDAMPTQQDAVKQLLNIVSRQQQAIGHLTVLLAHVSESVYEKNSAPAPARMALSELVSGDFLVGLPTDVDDLRKQLGLETWFAPDRR